MFPRFFNKNDYVRFSGIKRNRPALHPRGIAKRLTLSLSIMLIPSLSSATCTGVYVLPTTFTYGCTSYSSPWIDTGPNPDIIYMTFPPKSFDQCLNRPNDHVYKAYRANPTSGCPTGYLPDATCVCSLPDLGIYDGDPDGCRAAGGYPLLTGTGKIFSLPEQKCLTLPDYLTRSQNLMLTYVPAMSAGILGQWAAKGWSKLMNWLSSGVTPTGKSVANTNVQLALPKINPATGKLEPNIVETPTSPGQPPKFDLDEYNAYLRNVYFPQNPTQNPDLYPTGDLADLQRFNQMSQTYKINGGDPKVYTYTPNVGNIWKSTTGTPQTAPLYESPVMEPIPVQYATPLDETYPNLFNTTYQSPAPSVPAVYTTVPVTKTTTTGYNGSLPVSIWTNTQTFPDGSSMQETVEFNEKYKKGTHTITNVSSTGESTTTSVTFDAPNYSPSTANTPEAWNVKQTSPVSSTPMPLSNIETNPNTPLAVDPVTNLPVSPTTGEQVLPSSTTGQDIINAPMPSYSFPELSDFVPFESQPVTDMLDQFGEFFGNIRTQLSSTQEVFYSTKQMLEGKWQPPVIPAGSCGDFMSFDFHGKHIDLCAPMAQYSAEYSPVISTVTTLGGMGVAISIFLGGF